MFQFTRPQGARRQQMVVNRPLKLFQFTRPQGARQAIPNHGAKWTSFNSRARKGRDR